MILVCPQYRHISIHTRIFAHTQTHTHTNSEHSDGKDLSLSLCLLFSMSCLYTTRDIDIWERRWSGRERFLPSKCFKSLFCICVCVCVRLCVCCVIGLCLYCGHFPPKIFKKVQLLLTLKLFSCIMCSCCCCCVIALDVGIVYQLCCMSETSSSCWWRWCIWR